MRNQWRLLLLQSLRTSSTAQTSTTNHFQPQKVSHSLSYLFSFFIGKTAHVRENTYNFFSIRSYSSKPNSEQPKEEVDYTFLINILSKSTDDDEIETELESLHLCITHDMVLRTLHLLANEPGTAWKFFNYVRETENGRLSSKAYNSMLGILSRKGYVDIFWGLIEEMKKNGFRIHDQTNGRVAKNFKKEGMVEDLERFKIVYGSKENYLENVASKVCKLIRRHEWDEEVLNKLRGLGVSWSNDLVSMVIGCLKPDPLKALMFFWWVEEDPSFRHNKVSYNVMLKVSGREDSIKDFWLVVDEMRGAGYEMDMDTYVFVIERFYGRRNIKYAVDLYEFMMSSETNSKPTVDDSIVLFRKIVMSKDFDINLLSKALKSYSDGGNSLTSSNLNSVVKALSSVEKLQECGKIFKIMQEYGYVPTSEDYNRIIYLLGSVGQSDEASQIVNEMEASGLNPDYMTYTSLIHGLCVAREMEKALSYFQMMVEKIGVADASSYLVDGFCQKKRAEDAYKIISKFVDNTELQPLHKTYKRLMVKLLRLGNLNEALGLLRLMKREDHPLYLDSFIHSISNYGTAINAIRFLRVVTNKKYPSTAVFIQMFEAFFKAGRHSEAKICLSKCPNYIRSHADILNLFSAQKPRSC